MTAPMQDQAVEQARVIDVSTICCPCCAEDTWCPGERARAAMDAARAPELVIGVGTYGVGRRWDR